jgi:deazaflavin-dependent oxidoreductase (nitroreductase family)
MNEDAAQALASDQVIDITTTGRKSGQPRRIEIWYHRLDGRYYITGTPNRPRDWYANLVANPDFTFHLKQSATADLAATARPITEPAEREHVLDAILATLSSNPSFSDYNRADWLGTSPLVEVTFAA